WLARLLGDDQPFYGLQIMGEKGRRALRSVETAAAHHLEAVRQSGIHTQSALCGWSFGGYIAYEMGQQLVAAGQPPPVVILLDTHISRWEDDAPPPAGTPGPERLKAPLRRAVF